MKIAICDDNRIFLDELKQVLLEAYPQIERIDTYYDVERFFEKLSEGAKYDLIFLDIDWGEIKTTGLEFGERLYKIMPHVPIILVTGYNDRFAQHILLSEMNLIGYLTKPVDRQVLAQYMEKAKGKSKKIHYLNLMTQRTMIRLRTDDVIYIESHNHQIAVHTDADSYLVYEKISDIMQRLPDYFVQCHKSYLINLNYVSIIDSKSAHMINGKKIPVSRASLSGVKDRFFAFMGEML